MSSASADRISYDKSRVSRWNEDNLVKFYESALKSGMYACFGFVRDNGSVDQHNNGCFGMMHTYTIDDTRGWGVALKYASMKELDGKPVEHELWWTNNFLLNPKFSPWRTLVEKMVIVRNKQGVPIAALLADKDKVKTVDKGLLQNFNIASRQPFDRPDMVASVHSFYKSGIVNKKEAVLLRGVFNMNPVTGNVTMGSAGSFGTAFLSNAQYLRFLEGTPNSSMAIKGGRHLQINSAMSSDNDRHVWGMDGRNDKDLQNFLRRKIPSVEVKTFFGGVIHAIDKKAVKAWVEEFRSIYRDVLKQPAKGVVGKVEFNDDEDEDDF